jgi:hypothetical protein
MTSVTSVHRYGDDARGEPAERSGLDTDRPNASAVVPPWPGEHHVCAECGFSYPQCSRLEAAGIIDRLPDAVRRAVADVPRGLLHTRPGSAPAASAPSVGWSVTEYVCHLRDVCVVSTLRLHRTRTEDRPVLEPMLNDYRARVFRYDGYDIDAVLTELDLVSAALHEEILDTASGEWTRIAVRDVHGAGEEHGAGEVRSAGWIIRNAAHEAVHHLRDVDRLCRIALRV